MPHSDCFGREDIWCCGGYHTASTHHITSILESILPEPGQCIYWRLCICIGYRAWDWIAGQWIWFSDQRHEYVLFNWLLDRLRWWNLHFRFFFWGFWSLEFVRAKDTLLWWFIFLLFAFLWVVFAAKLVQETQKGLWAGVDIAAALLAIVADHGDG